MRIKKFLELYPNENTIRVYRAGIYDFLDCTYGKVRRGKQANKEEKGTYEKFAERYFTEQRDYFEDLLKFMAYMHGKPPSGSRAKIAGVHEFLSYQGVELTRRQDKILSTKKPKGNNARTAEKDVDTEILKKLLTHMDLKGKAAVLTLASSGMRIGEMLQVKLSDIDLTTTPPELIIRGEHSKTGDTRVVFVSREAKETLAEWLKIRDQYLKSAQNRNKGLVKIGKAKEKAIDDDRLFPFTDRNVREMWENSLTKAGLWYKDNSTGRTQIRIHALRKFFRSQLALSCPLDIVEALMGHEGYLTEAYRRYTKKQMGEYYVKAEHHVTVMGSGDIREIQDKLQDTHAAVEGYRGIISKQAEEMAELRQKYDKIEADLDVMKTREEIRMPYDMRMTVLMKRLIENPEIKELIKKESRGIKGEET